MVLVGNGWALFLCEGELSSWGVVLHVEPKIRNTLLNKMDNNKIRNTLLNKMDNNRITLKFNNFFFFN